MFRYYCLLSFLCLWLQATCQQFDPGKLHIGFRGGFNAVGISPQHNYGQNLMSYKIPLRPSFGLTSQVRLGIKSYVQADLLYQQMGQKHEDFFKGSEFYKDIRLNYVVVPVQFKYVLNPLRTGYDAAATFRNPNWYIAGGLQPGFMTSASIRHEINGQLTDFIGFITEGGNPNEEEIRAMDPPASDEDLYNAFDLSVVGSAGFFTRFQQKWIIFVDIRGGFSLLDINAETWRLPAPSGNYFASRNAFIGISAGLAYKIF